MARTTLREYLQSAEDAISTGRIDDAFINCQYVLSYFPESLEAQRLMGEVYLAQGQLNEAQQTFDWVLTNDPENIIAYCDRALICERMSDLDTALDCYQQAYELSRGNSQIRQEFNQLSAKIGQPGFMFSRAGLARLYMRGDLLPQAIQEWETVLSANPDRLDGRIGLIEVCWRENQPERVEELATQLLEEVPGCLKALLLLAHVTSSHNMQRTQELLQRAKTLDPELIMANEIFSDLMASQPKDPFLALLKKEPVFMPETTNSKAMSAEVAVPPPVSNGSAKLPAMPNSITTWSGLDTLIEPDASLPPMPEPPPLPGWTSLSNEPQPVDPWANLGQFSTPGKQDVPELTSIFENKLTESKEWSVPGQSVEFQMDAWESIQDINQFADPALAHDQALLEQQPWLKSQPEQSIEQSYTVADDPWSSLSTFGSKQDAPQADIEDVEEQPAPPAWLDMLTFGERRQPSGGMPAMPSSFSAEPPAAKATPPRQPAEPIVEKQSKAIWGEPPASVPSIHFEQDEEASFFGPAWLKSLGATSMSMDGITNAEPEELPVLPEVPELLQEVPVLQNWGDALMVPPAKSEQNVITTLENLEQSLFSQGFMPLERGSLASIAREQEKEPMADLSSALAQLGQLAAQPATTFPGEVKQPVFPEETRPVQPDEIWWAAPPVVPETIQSQPPVVAPALPPMIQASTPPPVPQPQIVEAPAFQASEPTIMPAAPVVRSEPLLENELETTMKRPAIRLQPMQHSQASAQDVNSLLGKGRSHGGEQASKVKESEPSYKDRLLRGYQYQLAGSYDEAMNEYRLIIRGAPELVGEVISNLRALLKLAPKYTPGYRVLGDAYMRQGDYLQAMEVYNKALTMAKRAKG